MKLLVFGCEQHVFDLLQRVMARHSPPTPAVNVSSDCDIEAVLQEHLPSHIVAGNDELAVIAQEAVAKLGMNSKVQPFRVPTDQEGGQVREVVTSIGTPSTATTSVF